MAYYSDKDLLNQLLGSDQYEIACFGKGLQNLTGPQQLAEDKILSWMLQNGSKKILFLDQYRFTQDPGSLGQQNRKLMSILKVAELKKISVILTKEHNPGAFNLRPINSNYYFSSIIINIDSKHRITFLKRAP